MSESFEEARARRHGWPVRIFPLGLEPPDDALDTMTPSERVALVWELSARRWELSGHPLPSYTRATIPVRIVRSE